MSYEIETGVELPFRRYGRYPWYDLAIGQGFFVEGREKRIVPPSYLREKGWRFAQAIMPKNGSAGSPMGLRVKRVA